MTEEPITSYICHCHRCQKRTGSPFSMSVVIPANGLSLEQGEPLRTERALPNGTKNYSYICGDCHSRLYTHRAGSPTLNLRAGTLDDTSCIRPVAQIWTSSAQPWALIPEAVLSYAEQPTDFSPIVEAWKSAFSADSGTVLQIRQGRI